MSDGGYIKSVNIRSTDVHLVNHLSITDATQTLVQNKQPVFHKFSDFIIVKSGCRQAGLSQLLLSDKTDLCHTKANTLKSTHQTAFLLFQ